MGVRKGLIIQSRGNSNARGCRALGIVILLMLILATGCEDYKSYWTEEREKDIESSAVAIQNKGIDPSIIVDCCAFMPGDADIQARS